MKQQNTNKTRDLTCHYTLSPEQMKVYHKAICLKVGQLAYLLKFKKKISLKQKSNASMKKKTYRYANDAYLT